MKRFVLTVLILAALALTVSEAGAEGRTFRSVQRILDSQNNIKAVIVTFAWTADQNGAVPSAIVDAAAFGITGWYLYTAQTVPGIPAPTPNYDIAIKDADGFDIAGGLLADRSDSASQTINAGTTPYGYPLVRGDLTFELANNTEAGATGKLIMIFLP